MRVLDRYIVKAICGSVTLVLAVLLTLLGVFLFIDEQGWVGVGHYGQLQALHFVLLNLPANLVQFLPIAALIGSLLAMGGLARGSELTVMRAAGVSIARIALAVFLAGVLLVPLALLTGEYLAPPLTQFARAAKVVARNEQISLTSRSAAWIRDGNQILRAERAAGEAGLGGITVFELGPSGQLAAVGQAPQARALPDGSWELADYAASRFAEDDVAFGIDPVYRFQTRASPLFLDAVTSDPMDWSLRELHAAIGYLAANGQETRHYRFAFWSGIARLAALPLAVLLAVPFLFGSSRHAESSARALLGLLLGLGYFILQRMVESGTLAFALDPLLLAWLPTAALGTTVGLLLARLRSRVLS